MSKFMDKQKQIEKSVVSGYKAIEDGAVSGYKKIEDTFVSGYKKIEDKFVDTFLTPSRTEEGIATQEKTLPAETEDSHE